MNSRYRLVLLGSVSCMSACASSAQFSGTVIMGNKSPVTVSLYEVRGLERRVPSLPSLSPVDQKWALLGPMRAPDTLRIRWSYVEVWAAGGDPNATETVLPVPRLPDPAGKKAPDLLLTFTSEKRWSAAWSAR